MSRCRRRFAARKSAGAAGRLLPAEQAAQTPAQPAGEAAQCARPRCRLHSSHEIAAQIRIPGHEGEAAADAVYALARYFWAIRKRGQAGVTGCRSLSLLCHSELKGPAPRFPADGALLLYRAAAGPARNCSPAAHSLLPLPAAADGERVRLCGSLPIAVLAASERSGPQPPLARGCG